MRESKLRELWKADQAAINGWLTIPDNFVAETMAHHGWGTLTIDLQHGVVDYSSMLSMLQAISTTSTMPIVRVPWLEPGILMKVLDAGAYAVICPMMNTHAKTPRTLSPGPIMHLLARAVSDRCERCSMVVRITLRTPTTP